MYDIDAALDQQILRVQKNRPAVMFSEATDRAHHRGGLPPDPLRAAGLPGLRGGGQGRWWRGTWATSIPRGWSSPWPRAPSATSRRGTTCWRSSRRPASTCPTPCARPGTWTRPCACCGEPARFGIMAVRQGHADMVVGGIQHEPRDFFRPMIRLLAKQEILCEAGVFVLPDGHPEGIFPHNIAGDRRRGRERHHDPRGAGQRGRGHLRRGPRHLPGGRPAHHQRRHGLLQQQGLGRGAQPRTGAPRRRAGARGAGRAHHPRPPLRDHPHRGRGEGERGPVPAQRPALPPGPGHELRGRHQRDHRAQPGHGEPAVPPVRHALSRGQEVQRDVRPALPGRGPAHGLHRRGRHARASRPACCGCTASGTGAARPRTPSSGATASWP